MKQGYSWLNTKEVKRIRNIFLDNYNYEFDFSSYALCINEKNKIYMINRDVDRIDLDKVRINTIGLYLGELKDNEIRISIEFSQMIGPNAKSSIIELNDENAAKWLRGYDLDLERSHKGFVLIKNKNNFLGCSKHKNNQLMNFVPKERRIKSID
ncbi:hypothetical protein C0585_05330 [Candidatus Woesearchaeota archaeon]|nr:MAG: hypothetical protein C0585_05330 [Candidatus Woesearchaeota archaeon]